MTENPAAQFRRPFALLACLFGMAISGWASTWMTAAGDRLSGELLRETEETIEIQHPQLGRLILMRTEWMPLPEPSSTDGASAAADVGLPQAVEHESHETGSQAKTAEKAEKKSEKDEGDGGEDDEEDDKAKAKPTAKKSSPKWKRQVEVGFVQQSGSREKRDLSLRAQVEGRRGSNTFRATSRLLKSDADGKVVTDRREAEFRWRYDLSKRLFTQAQTNYVEDDVRQIDLSLEQQVGGGYRILDTLRHKANVGLGAVVQYLQRVGADEATTLLGSFFQDYTFALNKRLQVMQEATVQLTDNSLLNNTANAAASDADNNYRFKVNTGVQSKITNHMSLNVRYEYDYDGSVEDAALRKDQRLTTSLGYVW